MILYRGETDVEKGFRDHFAGRLMPVEYLVRDVAMDVARVREHVAEARAWQADLIYTWGTPVSLAVAGRIGAVDPAVHVADIPVVFTMVATPVACGLVPSLTSSGRNVTGTCHVVPVRQQLAAIRAYRPFRRVGIVYNPAEPNSVQTLRELRAAMRAEGMTLIERAVPLDDARRPVPDSLPDLVAGLAERGANLLYIGPDSFLATHRTPLTDAALAAGLPCFSATEVMLREGKALFGLVADYGAVGRLTAHKAAQILLRRTDPAQIPIETLARFTYVVNMRVAGQLNLPPPRGVSAYAELLT
jgi:putative ABC transport system substrate-binding protein